MRIEVHTNLTFRVYNDPQLQFSLTYFKQLLKYHLNAKIEYILYFVLLLVYYLAIKHFLSFFFPFVCVCFYPVSLCMYLIIYSPSFSGKRNTVPSYP
jgi:hypothetical protein